MCLWWTCDVRVCDCQWHAMCMFLYFHWHVILAVLVIGTGHGMSVSSRRRGANMPTVIITRGRDPNQLEGWKETTSFPADLQITRAVILLWGDSRRVSVSLFIKQSRRSCPPSQVEVACPPSSLKSLQGPMRNACFSWRLTASGTPNPDMPTDHIWTFEEGHWFHVNVQMREVKCE